MDPHRSPSRRWKRGSTCIPRCGPPRSSRALGGGAEKPARRPQGEPAVPDPLFWRVDRSMPPVTFRRLMELGVAAISLGFCTGALSPGQAHCVSILDI